MGLTRVFLGWEQSPAITAAARFAQEARSGCLDLGGVLCLTPSSRSARILLVHLVQAAESLGVFLTPPQFVQSTELVSLLLPEPGAPASKLACRAVWQDAVRHADAAELAGLVSAPPGPEAPQAVAGIASMLARAHDELAASFLTFGEVPASIPGGMVEPESQRWRAAQRVADRAARMFASMGLRDEAAWSLNAAKDATRTAPGRVVLVGVTELAPTARRLLNLPGADVECWIAAPAEKAHAFDEFGCPDERAWADAPLPTDDTSVLFADSPVAQSDAALWALARRPGLSVQDVLLVVPEAGLSEILTLRARARARIRVHDASGAPGAASRPALLLDAASDYLETRDAASLAAFVRHPDVDAAFRRARTLPALWLQALDSALSTEPGAALPRHGAPGDSTVVRVVRAADSLLGVMSDTPREQELGAWSEALAAFLGAVYSGRQLRRDHRHDDPLRESLSRAATLIEDLASLRGKDAPPGTFADACRLVAEVLAEDRIPPEPEPDAVELVGWLEALFDPAPHVVFVGMNEGVVPQKSGPEPLLCAPIRRALGLPTDSRRFARDAYLLAAACAGRRSTAIICGRRGAEGEPLLPSRLLLRGDAAHVAARLLRFSKTGLEPRRGVGSKLRGGGASTFPIAPLVAAAVPEALSVTSLKTYVASPYHYYLAHVLKLREFDEIEDELDPAGFGSMVHAALHRFATHADSSSSDPRVVHDSLLAALRGVVGERFGDQVAPSLAVQVETAARRLEAFAPVQAQRAAAGWRIRYAEWSPRDGATRVELDGETFLLAGKIDRVDRNEDGRIAILDYKTSDTGADPLKAHVGRAGWTDFQLPLYRRMALAAGLVAKDAKVELGYVALPARGEETQFLPADFELAQLAECEKQAAEVLRSIRRAEFAELGRAPPREGILAALCGVGIPVLGEPSP